MAKPINKPVLARDLAPLPSTGLPNKAAPDAILQSIGYDKNQRPAVEEINYLFGVNLEWIEYFEGAVDSLGGAGLVADQNLLDVDSRPAAFNNIKQGAVVGGASGVVEIGTEGETLTGTNTTKVASISSIDAAIVAQIAAQAITTTTEIGTAVSTNTTATLATAGGWTDANTGMIVKWGQNTSNALVTFPTPFPNACFTVVVTPEAADGKRSSGIDTLTAASFNLYVAESHVGTPEARNCFWIAIGH
ncbi:hypothetical protein N9937_00420 [bacterium]|nr:hypothetical protein [bacterium]